MGEERASKEREFLAAAFEKELMKYESPLKEQLKAAWETQVFKLPKFKNTATCTIAGFDEALALLDEHIVNSQAM